MLMQAFEILNSVGSNSDSYETDFGLYKIIYILSVYFPLLLSTFLLSQEYLGDKIACFAPENFTDAQAGALNEYCWNNGYWISEGVPHIKSLYTQPHRFYPLYLPIQGVTFMSPIVLWNIFTKSHLLAVLKGTEDFLEDLLQLTDRDNEEDKKQVADKCRELLRQFHDTCVTAARASNLAKVGVVRVSWEMFLMVFTLTLQFFIYNHKVKDYSCSLSQMGAEDILCTVPILDLLDIVWSLNVSSLLLALTMNLYMLFKLYQMHFSAYQPMFYNNLPYGSTDNFNLKVTWDSPWTKDSYRLLTRIFEQNNSIMTKAYVLMAIKPEKNQSGDQQENKGMGGLRSKKGADKEVKRQLRDAVLMKDTHRRVFSEYGAEGDDGGGDEANGELRYRGGGAGDGNTSQDNLL